MGLGCSAMGQVGTMGLQHSVVALLCYPSVTTSQNTAKHIHCRCGDRMKADFEQGVEVILLDISRRCLCSLLALGYLLSRTRPYAKGSVYQGRGLRARGKEVS